MNAIAFKYICGECGGEFKAPGISDFAYGLFVMWSEQSGEVVFLDALSDSVFSEVSGLVHGNPLLKCRPEEDQSDIFQAIFGMACDKSKKGDLFSIVATPKCPSCGSRKMKAWDVADPGYAWPLPVVTHESWNAKAPPEKAAIIHEAIRAYLDAHR